MGRLYDILQGVAETTRVILGYIKDILFFFLNYPMQSAVAIIAVVVALFLLGSIYRRMRIIERRINYNRASKKQYTTNTKIKKAEEINKRRSEVGHLAQLLEEIRTYDASRFDEILGKFSTETSFAFYKARIAEMNVTNLIEMEEILNKILRHYTDKPLIPEAYEEILKEVRQRYGDCPETFVES